MKASRESPHQYIYVEKIHNNSLFNEFIAHVWLKWKIYGDGPSLKWKTNINPFESPNLISRSTACNVWFLVFYAVN